VNARAFELSEQARARALLDLIRNREVRHETPPQDDVAHEVGMIERRLQGASSLPSANEAHGLFDHILAFCELALRLRTWQEAEPQRRAKAASNAINATNDSSIHQRVSAASRDSVWTS
jgi:hypothetical protein